jgi:ACS family D-galactonate transporter-like MFS transporter
VNPTLQTSGPDVYGAALNVSNRRRWGIVGLLFSASMLNYMDRATVSMALPFISSDLRLGPAAKGELLSVFFASYALMQIPIGWCADRFNLKWLYAGMFLLWSLAQGLSGFTASLAALMMFRVILGIGESIYLPGGTKIVSLLFTPAKRGLPSGLFDFGTRTGLVLDGILIPWMIVHYGWRRMLMLVGFAALLWLIPWILVFPSGLRAPKRTADSRPRVSFWRTAWVLISNRNLIGICLGFFCFDYYWYLLVNWLPDYLVTVRHLTILKAGLFASLPFFVFGVSEPLGGWIADGLTRRGVSETFARKGVVTAAFLMGLLLTPAALVESASAAILLIMGASLVGLATGNLLAILQACAPPAEVGIWTGVENFVGNVAGFLAPLATGFLISWTGSYLPGFALAAVTLVAGLLAYWFIVGPLPQSQTAE